MVCHVRGRKEAMTEVTTVIHLTFQRARGERRNSNGVVSTRQICLEGLNREVKLSRLGVGSDAE